MLQAAFGPPAYGDSMPEKSRMDVMAEELAAMNHSKWLRARLLDAMQKGGEMAPREKTLSGKTFDIAVNWERLHPLWKSQEAEASKMYITSLLPIYQELQRERAASMERAASQVHEIWMRQNPWAKDQQPELFVDYDDLPEDEKEKDRVVARNVFGIYAANPF